MQSDINAIRIAIADVKRKGLHPTGVELGAWRWERIMRDNECHTTRDTKAPVSELLGLPVTIVPNNPEFLEVTYAR